MEKLIKSGCKELQDKLSAETDKAKAAEKMLKENALEEEHPLNEPISDSVKVSTPPRKLSSPVSLIVVAVTTLPDDKIVMVTQTGEIMVFDEAFNSSFSGNFLTNLRTLVSLTPKRSPQLVGFVYISSGSTEAI